jgi:hypothetical protein
MVFEPDAYSESSIIMENIIVEALREFIIQNRETKWKKQVLRVSLPVALATF